MLIVMCTCRSTCTVNTLYMIIFVEDAGGDLKYDFLQEISLMKKVAEGSNPFVVNMVGCSTTTEPLALVMEFVPRGNLLEFLKGYRRKVRTYLHFNYYFA